MSNLGNQKIQFLHVIPSVPSTVNGEKQAALENGSFNPKLLGVVYYFLKVSISPQQL